MYSHQHKNGADLTMASRVYPYSVISERYNKNEVFRNMKIVPRMARAVAADSLMYTNTRDVTSCVHEGAEPGPT